MTDRTPTTEAGRRHVAEYIDAEAGNEFNDRMEQAWKALRAALAARSEPPADFGSQGGPTTGYGIATYPARSEPPERQE